jgi:hypothetical protein
MAWANSGVSIVNSWRLDVERAAMGELFAGRAYAAMFVSLFVAFSTLYMFLLPSLPLGTPVPQAIGFLTPLQAAFALVFGFLIALVISLDALAFRMKASSARSLTVGSILASLVNGLCCTPVVPTIIAMTGASTPALFGLSPRIQAFFEFNYPYFYALSVGLLLISVHYVSRSIFSCCGAGRMASIGTAANVREQ